MNDADGGVREAFAEVVGALAENYHQQRKEALPCTHPFFKVPLDGLQAAKKEMQVAAGIALCTAAPHTGVLDTALVKHLLRLLITQAFHAKQHVMAAFAHWDTEKRRGAGFVSMGSAGVVPSIGALIGNSSKPNAPGERLLLTSHRHYRQHRRYICTCSYTCGVYVRNVVGCTHVIC
jgi:hypothetical protein